MYTGHITLQHGASDNSTPTRVPCAVKTPNQDGLREFDAELQIMTRLVQLGSHPCTVAVLVPCLARRVAGFKV